MTTPSIEHVLWLCGPDAVGKTTVAWEIYQTVAQGGIGVAYVDTDYLGFCEPLPNGEPTSLVAANLTSMGHNFAAAGAQALVVSGILYSDGLRRQYEAALPAATFTVCRLRASGPTLADRIVRRGIAEGAGTDGAVSGHDLEALEARGRQAAGFAERLDRTTFADVVIETDDVPVVEVASRVLAAVGPWPVLQRG